MMPATPGAAGLNAAQQITMARTTGKYYPGELTPDDPAIVSAIAEYKRTGGHHNPGQQGAVGTGPTIATPSSYLDAGQQITMARTTGKYYPGELGPDDPAITSAIMEYKRTGGHHKPNPYDVAPVAPMPMDTSRHFAGEGKVVFQFEISSRWPDGRYTRDVLFSDPVAMEDISARAIEIAIARKEGD
jgi:hypothetical protein